MNLTEEQLQELETEAKTAQPAYLRIRILAIWHVAKGKTHAQAADCVCTTRQSVGSWINKFDRFGIEGLLIRHGRGRKPEIDHDDVKEYALQSPRNFGIDRTRWTLKLLSEIVPSLKGFSGAGVLKVLRQMGLSYKRGQPHISSPDPQYIEKKTS